MKHIHTIDELHHYLDDARASGKARARGARRDEGATRAGNAADLPRSSSSGRSVIGFVPTMGFLHEGHVSLMRAARSRCDVVVASIFVNPLQFAAGEDLEDYPRNLERDAELSAEAGVDVLFVPTVDEMYPDGLPIATTVSVAGVSEGFEGGSRPTHFAGVATVVAKLLSIVGPCAAFFGDKDFQQLAVVRRMVADLSIPVDVVGCETVRESDGLAMSSRNAYLTPEQRAAAPVVNRALRSGVATILAGETDPDAVIDLMAKVVAGEPLGELDYADVVDAATLSRPSVLSGDLRVLAAVRFARTRLIDNVGVTVPAPCTTGYSAPTQRS